MLYWYFPTGRTRHSFGVGSADLPRGRPHVSTLGVICILMFSHSKLCIDSVFTITICVSIPNPTSA